ncbi:MAG TPA: hypothetical protein VF292_08350 [Rhodanobacteraceae bacterium]
MHYFLKFAAHVLVALAGALAAYILFKSVLPAPAVEAVSIVIFVAGLIGFIVTAKSGAGHGFRLLLRLGWVVLVWPLFAWALQYAGLHDRGVRIGLAAAAAAGVGLWLGQTKGSKEDTQRLMAVMAAVAIPAYAMIHALVSGDGSSLIAACVAVAVAIGAVVKTQTLQPEKYKDAPLVAFLIVAGAGVFAVLRTLV